MDDKSAPPPYNCHVCRRSGVGEKMAPGTYDIPEGWATVTIASRLRGIQSFVVCPSDLGAVSTVLVAT